MVPGELTPTGPCSLCPWFENKYTCAVFRRGINRQPIRRHVPPQFPPCRAGEQYRRIADATCWSSDAVDLDKGLENPSSDQAKQDERAQAEKL